MNYAATVAWEMWPIAYISLVSQFFFKIYFILFFFWKKTVFQYSQSRSEKALMALYFGDINAGFGMATQVEMVYLQQ